MSNPTPSAAPLNDLNAEPREPLSAEPSPFNTSSADPLGAPAMPPADEPEPIAELVKRIADGELNADDLAADVRHVCVSHLFHDGFTSGEIARLMRMNERTVRRDRLAARRAGGLRPDRLLADDLLGEFQEIALGSVQRLIRLANNRETAQYVRLWAEEAMVRNYQRLIDTVSRLHYLEPGGERLEYQRDTDPQRMERLKARQRAERQALDSMFPGK